MKKLIPWLFFGPLLLILGGLFTYWATGSTVAASVAAVGAFLLAAIMVLAFIPNLIFFWKRHGDADPKLPENKEPQHD